MVNGVGEKAPSETRRTNASNAIQEIATVESPESARSNQSRESSDAGVVVVLQFRGSLQSPIETHRGLTG